MEFPETETGADDNGVPGNDGDVPGNDTDKNNASANDSDSGNDKPESQTTPSGNPDVVAAQVVQPVQNPINPFSAAPLASVNPASVNSAGGEHVAGEPALGAYSPRPPRPRRNEKAVSVIGFACSILGLATCGVLSVVGVVFSILGLRSEPRGLATAGYVINLIGIVMLLLSFAFVGGGMMAFRQMTMTGFQNQMASSETSSYLNQAAEKIGIEWKATGQLPNADEGDALILGINDSWNKQLYYETDGTSFSVSSAGPDGKTGNIDDISIGPFLSEEEVSGIVNVFGISPVNPWIIQPPVAGTGGAGVDAELEEDPLLDSGDENGDGALEDPKANAEGNDSDGEEDNKADADESLEMLPTNES